MFRTTLIATALTVSALSAAPSFAGNAGAGLGACYDHVISACNQNSKHPQACASSGMDACDELHSAKDQASLGSIKMYKDPSRPGGYRFVVPAKLKAMNLSDGRDDRDRSPAGTARR